jgi:hypothetical protein
MDSRWTVRSRLWRPRFCSEPGEVEFVFIPEDMERAVEPLADDDIGARWRQRSLRSQQLDKLSVEGDGPVVVDLPGLLNAEDVVKIDASSRTMDVGKTLGMSEASVVVIDEERLQKGVGVFDGGDVLLPQILDETILMGAIGSFDTPLGLWGMSIDAANTKTLHSLAESG